MTQIIAEISGNHGGRLSSSSPVASFPLYSRMAAECGESTDLTYAQSTKSKLQSTRP